MSSVDRESIFEGWLQGFYFGLSHDATAIAYIATASVLLDRYGIHGKERRAIWQWAEYDAALDLPDLPITTQKAVAARKVALLIGRRMRREARA